MGDKIGQASHFSDTSYGRGFQIVWDNLMLNS